MMIVGKRNATVQVPPWDFPDEHPTATIHSPFPVTNDLPFEAFAALRRYLPSNTAPDDDGDYDVGGGDDLDIPVDAFSCDQFRMYDFKVRKCTRSRSHDWTECPYAHPGEIARRRDPRKYNYSGSSCPDFRKGGCKKGDSCEFAHGVFECWLHPARYRTQPCKDGTHCRRRVCFFAHTPDQLRVLPLPVTESYERFCSNSPSRLGFDSYGYSPTSVFYSPPSSPPSESSPPISPSGRLSLNSMSHLADSMRTLQIGNSPRMTVGSPTWGLQMGSSGFCSPRSPSNLRPVFGSLPSTPTRNQTRFDIWEKTHEEEPIMERVESGRDLRARIYAKLSKENSLDSAGAGSGPDLGWVSELVK